MTQRDRVQTMLEQAGEVGVTTSEFCAAYLPRAAARIKELRNSGLPIRTERLSPSSYKFTLLPATPQLTGTDARGVRSKAKTFAPSDRPSPDRLFESSTQPTTRSAISGQRIDDEPA